MKKKVFALLSLVLVLSILLPVAPTFATANPGSISLHTVKVFQNIFETDDILFLVSYDVAYGSPPSEDAEDTFQMAIYDEDGTTLIQSRPLNDYQYNVHSIYFTKAQADADLTWGSEYKVRVMGSPSYFPMTEDATMDTKTLSLTPNWIEGAATVSREHLRSHCLILAKNLEDSDDWTDLIAETAERDVLNSTGRTVFLAAIPGLDSVVTALFQIATSAMDITKQDRTAAYEEELTVESQLGTTIKSAFDGIGDYLGISGGMTAMAWALFFALTVASIVFLNSGNTTAALILAMPIVILGVAAGAIDMAILFTAAAILILYMGYHIWLRGM